MKKLNLEDINYQINKEFCSDTMTKLSDNNLMIEYKKQKSVLRKIKKLENILDKYYDNKIINHSIINDYIFELIPPGTKAVIRGFKFNLIVKDLLENYIKKKYSDKLNINFEKSVNIENINEIPDWYITEKNTGKFLIGMNQLDLWSGGHQINRAYKYLHYSNCSNIKIVCVVANFVKIKSNKNKVYDIFNTGFQNKTLCYIKSLPIIIDDFFVSN